MKPVPVTEKILDLFPDGSVGVEFGAPEGLENLVLPAQGVRLADAEGNLTPAVGFIWEFESHDEWKDFKRNRKLFVLWPFGDIAPINIGAFSLAPEHADAIDSTIEANDQN